MSLLVHMKSKIQYSFSKQLICISRSSIAHNRCSSSHLVNTALIRNEDISSTKNVLSFPHICIRRELSLLYTVTLLQNVSGKMHPTHVNCIFFETDVCIRVDVLHYGIFCRHVLCLKSFIQLHCFHTSTRVQFHDTFIICQPFFRHFPGTRIIFVWIYLLT